MATGTIVRRERKTLPDGRVYELEPTGTGAYNILWVIECPECRMEITTPYPESQAHFDTCTLNHRPVTR